MAQKSGLEKKKKVENKLRVAVSSWWRDLWRFVEMPAIKTLSSMVYVYGGTEKGWHKKKAVARKTRGGMKKTVANKKGTTRKKGWYEKKAFHANGGTKKRPEEKKKVAGKKRGGAKKKKKYVPRKKRVQGWQAKAGGKFLFFNCLMLM